MSQLLTRIRTRVDRWLDPVYRRVPVVLRWRHKAGHWKNSRAQKIREQWYSQANLPALQALSARRFDDYARFTALPLAEQQPLMPSIDISIVTYNSAKWLERFMSSLLQQDYPLAALHLYFVDHGSNDDTVAQLRNFKQEYKAEFASFTLIEQENLGFGAGHHRAIKQGSSEYCLVTNVDLVFRADSLTAVMRTALADTAQQVASWELRQVPYEHPKYYDAVTLECNWSSHACILMRRSAYMRVGGYDPRIFMYCEDVEMSYRFRSYGYVLKYVPRAAVHHYTYESAGQVKPMQYSGSLVGNMYLRLRYGSKKDQRMGLALYSAILTRPEPFEGASKALRQGLKDLVHNWRYFKKGKGDNNIALFPFYGLDYDYHREGAFFEVEPISVEQAPLVSIITRTYQGRSVLLRQAIQSVFNQTYPNIELIVVEDGGEHQRETVEQMTTIAPEGVGVRFIANPKLGRSSAGNTGLAAAQGRWLMFLDDDDLLFADHVETLASVLLAKPELAAAYALAIEVYTDMNVDRTAYIESVLHIPGVFYQEWDYSVMEHHNFIPIQAILFQRGLYEKWGGFDVELDQLEDWHLWQRYGYNAVFEYVAKTTSLFRSPAHVEIRTGRAQLLHEAYEEAKKRAKRDIHSHTSIMEDSI